jgi:hypothetical protein
MRLNSDEINKDLACSCIKSFKILLIDSDVEVNIKDLDKLTSKIKEEFNSY